MSPSSLKNRVKIPEHFYISITVEVKLKSLNEQVLEKEEQSRVKQALDNLEIFHKMVRGGEATAKAATLLASIVEKVKSLIF